MNLPECLQGGGESISIRMPRRLLAVGKRERSITTKDTNVHEGKARHHCFVPPASFTLECRMPTTGERFERAVAIMERLRAPGGCPWDREQTFDSIKPYTLEET